MFSFENLEVYQKSILLVKRIYKLLDSFPTIEKYALCDQIRRAIVSVPSNIAEQSGRTSPKEKIHFLEIAFGSLMETYCQIQIAVELGYISEHNFIEIKDDFTLISKLLSGLKRSFSKTL